uniref:Amyloid-beta A4 precursor protein-binding family A member 3 n=1 Tax=Sinocyclocheilus grahami TaxID=75366 RepID=A0A672S6G9_SINGR
MALRRRPGTRAIVSELNPSASSTAPVGSEKLSGDGVDPVFEELGQEKLDIQPPSPVPARYCLSDGSGDDSIQGESPLQQDSMEEDSLSEYDNAVSVEEEEEEQHDYEEDEELQTEADRMTYYVHCCPEDESYMEGMDCHEGADGAECPGTSRDVRESCKPEEAWEHSEGFYKVLQQDATTTVYKRPEPITETTFVQAPMAEDEEDEEETEEEAEEEDSEEEDNVGFSPALFISYCKSMFLHLFSVPGPCEPEDLINGIIFAANYLGSTQVLSDRNPSKSVRMKQAQEALDCVKSVEGEAQSLTEIDLFISTKAIKVLNADTQETMMDNALRTISYIADIGDVVVLMARRRLSNSSSLDCTDSGLSTESRKQYRMMCYVFESEDAQRRAQSIGQAFSMAYQEFLRDNGINPKDLSQKDYSDILSTQEMYNDDLIHFSNSENCKELQLEKQKGEMLGVVIVESGWGSILPTVILACMLNNGLAARSGKLNVGDQIMAVNDTSLVGLPLATCQGIIKSLKNHVQVKLSVVSCPPVTTVLIKRPDLQYQLGFSVQNGIICSLMRGGIAERGGVRVGHRIIEINGQSVVAMAHEKIVHALSVSVGEINMKTMPAVMFRLLTGQEPSVHIRNHKPGLFLQLKKKKKVYSSS